MNGRKRAQEMFDANLRAETIYHLATQAVDEDVISPGLRDDLEMDWPDIAEVVGLPPDLEVEGVPAYLARKGTHGFLVRMATPVPGRMTETSHQFSWGHYVCQWFYGETLDEVYSAALKWQAAYLREQRAKQVTS